MYQNHAPSINLRSQQDRVHPAILRHLAHPFGRSCSAFAGFSLYFTRVCRGARALGCGGATSSFGALRVGTTAAAGLRNTAAGRLSVVDVEGLLQTFAKGHASNRFGHSVLLDVPSAKVATAKPSAPGVIWATSTEPLPSTSTKAFLVASKYSSTLGPCAFELEEPVAAKGCSDCSSTLSSETMDTTSEGPSSIISEVLLCDLPYNALMAWGSSKGPLELGAIVFSFRLSPDSSDNLLASLRVPCQSTRF